MTVRRSTRSGRSNSRSKSAARIEEFNFTPGKILGKKYEVLSKLGVGWEGEVYIVRELGTDIERAAKVFFPHRNVKERTSIDYAKRLHQLRDCDIMVKYHSQEKLRFRGADISCLLSEYVEGELLSAFLKRQRGGRVSTFQGLHLLYSLADGIECIHASRQYHGDLHSENVIVRRHGLGFDLKLLDLYNWGRVTRECYQDDICDVIKIFYDALGGKKHYANMPEQVKDICCGLKRTLILRKFPTARRLRQHLEHLEWD